MRTPYVLLIDLICVIGFAFAGRGAHSEALGLGSVAATAWPFLIGAVVGWGVFRAWRKPLDLRTGALVMGATVVVGHLVRVLAGGSTHWSFILVSLIALTVLLVGWRLVAWTILHRRGVRV